MRSSHCAQICQPPRGSPEPATRRVSTPRSARFIHGYKFDGNSLARVTILSPFSPRKSFGNQADPGRCVVDKGDLVLVGPDQGGTELANLFHPLGPAGPSQIAHLCCLATPPQHSLPRWSWNRGHCSMVHVRPSSGPPASDDAAGPSALSAASSRTLVIYPGRNWITLQYSRIPFYLLEHAMPVARIAAGFRPGELAGYGASSASTIGAIATDAGITVS